MKRKTNKLHSIDPELWFRGYSRHIQKQHQPFVSDIFVPGVTCLQYRDRYYYSTDPERPYITFKFVSQSKHPLPITCTKLSYVQFLDRWQKGQFKDDEIVWQDMNFNYVKWPLPISKM